MAWVAVPAVAPYRKRPRLRWSRWLFLALGLGMLGYVGYALVDARLFQAYQRWRLDNATKTSVASAAAPPAQTLLPATSPIPARASFSPGSAIGRIEIARIGIDVIIAEGIDGRTLRRAVGHIPGTALPGEAGNVGIAGHRDTFFRALEGVRPGDEITLTTRYGGYRYRVDSARVVPPDDVGVLRDSGGALLTLVTCYPFYYVGPAPQRFVVRAHRE